MDENLDYISSRYAKIIDLVEQVDVNLAQSMHKFLSRKDKNIQMCLRQERDFDYYNNGIYAHFTAEENGANFRYVYNSENKYYLTDLKMIPLNKKTICDIPIETTQNANDNGLEVFSFSVRNSKKEPKLEIHVEQVANKYNYAVLSNKSFETRYVVDIKTDGNDNYLIRSLKLVNEIECEKKEIVLSEMDMVDFISPEDMRADEGRDFF